MLRKALLTAGLVLAFAAPAAADRCSFDMAHVDEVLEAPELSRAVRATVTDLVEQARLERKAGNKRACVTKLSAAKKILRIE